MFLILNSRKLENFLRSSYYFFIAVFPFLIYEGYMFNGSSTRSINTILFVEIVAIILGVYLLSLKNKIFFRFSPITTTLAFFLLIITFSSIFGVDFGTSFWSKATRSTGLFYFFHIGLFYIFFSSLFREMKDIRTFLKVFVISAGLLSIVSILGQEGVGWLFKNKGWQGVTIGNSTFAGMYIYAGFMMSIYLLSTMQKQDKAWWKNILPLVFVFSPYLLSFDVWRGELEGIYSIIGSAQASSITLILSSVALLASYLVWQLKNPKTRKTILFSGFFLSLIIFSLAGASLLKKEGKIQQVYLSQSTATRPIVWSFSKDAINEKPLLGWGVDNFDKVFQKYYDNRVLELKNGGEAWLDRAHNIFVDQTIETGYLGTISYVFVYLSIFITLLYVLVRSKDRETLILSTVLLVYFFGHLLELQTAFDTTINYVYLACFVSVSSYLFLKTRSEVLEKDIDIEVPDWMKYSSAIILLGFSLVMFVIGTVPIMKAEGANGAIRRVGSSEKRIPLYENLFSSPLDEGTFIWKTYNDIQRGVSQSPSVLEDDVQRNGLGKELDVIVSYYEEYINEKPNDFRARLGVSDLYIYQRLLGYDNLDKAHIALDEAISLVPNTPQPYWIKSVAYLYQGNFNLAKEFARKAYDLNPDIEESKRLKDYIETSIKEFPVIDLYSFKQI